jgi:hypothetical protein
MYFEAGYLFGEKSYEMLFFSVLKPHFDNSVEHRYVPLSLSSNYHQLHLLARVSVYCVDPHSPVPSNGLRVMADPALRSIYHDPCPHHVSGVLRRSNQNRARLYLAKSYFRREFPWKRRSRRRFQCNQQLAKVTYSGKEIAAA